jgi:hypothetical protein
MISHKKYRSAIPFTLFAKPIFVLLFSFILLYQADAQSARPFIHPDRIRYDGECLTIDGKDVFIYSGAFHFFRCPKELWHDRFQKIKDAGFNTVETYVPWNWCERQMPAGLDDFSKADLKDFDDWLTMAEQFGFYIIVRPGPYICAEWDTGGFPQWLLTKAPKTPPPGEGWLRSDDPAFLAWSKHWYDAVCPVIAKHQITRKAPGQPGVILVQVENEYDFPNFSEDVKINQVKALAGFARADGIDVPLITCWTHPIRGKTDPVLRQIFDCCNFYPRWDVDGILPAIQELRREQPDAPLATTELQGGWFSNVGGTLSENQDGVTASQINNLTLFVIQNGETILNYYMLFGGTNPDDRAARWVTTCYDYNAPIREWGGVGDRYQVVRAIGFMLQKHGVSLARSQAVTNSVTASQKDVTVVERRALDGGRYFFIRTSQHQEPRQGTATIKESAGDSSEVVINYQLEPFGSKILYLPSGVNDVGQGQWLPEAAPAIERPAASDLPAGITIASAKMRTDPGPKHWTKLKAGETLARAGVYDSHFIFYSGKVSCATATNFEVKYPDGDSVLVAINGKPAECISHSGSCSIFALPAGRNAIELFYENHGFDNGGKAMAQQGGIIEAGTTRDAFAEGTAVSGWRMQVVSGTTNRPEIESDFDDGSWGKVAVDNEDANQLSPNQDAVFRAVVNLTPAELSGEKMVLSFKRIDDLGWVYVNGVQAGTTTDWSQAYSFDVTKELHPGRNIIAVVVQNIGGGGGIGKPELNAALENSGGQAVALRLFGRPAGDEKEWWAPDLNDKHWESVPINETARQDNSALTWYRMNFSLPSQQTGVWVPWRLRLMAHGNGFLYLNGHPLGRYWDVGPQHDFFLPECWLHFGSTNNLTLDLRPTEHGVGIQSAEVKPYDGFAEKR